MPRFIRVTFFLALLSLTLACGLFQSAPSARDPLWVYANPNFSPDYASIQSSESGLVTYQSGASNELPISLITLNPASGEEIFTPTPNDELVIFEGVAAGRAIFVGRVSDQVNEDGDVLYPIIALDPSTGLEVWRYDGSVFESGIPRTEKYLFVSKRYSQIDVVDLMNGEVVASFTKEYDAAELFDLNPGWIRYMYTDTAIYSLSPAGVLRRYDLPTLTLQSTLNLDIPHYLDAFFIEGDRLYVYSAEVLDSDLNLLAFDLASGTHLWELRGMRGSTVGLEFYNGFGYVDTVNGPSKIDLSNGQVLWSVSVQLTPFFIGDDSNGVFLVTQDGLLTAYDSTSGKELWTYRTGQPNSINLSAVNGVAFITTAEDLAAFESFFVPNQLDAVDIATGKALWRYKNPYVTLPIGTDNAFIVGYYGGITALPAK